MVKLMADSTCDLSKAILDQYDISMASLTITIKGKEYRDRVDIEPDDFYKLLGSLEKLPTTAMPSPTEYMTIMDEAIEKGYKDILCICMSSGTSGSYQSAMIAKEYFDEKYHDSGYRLHVVDSKGMSHGSGYLLIKSAMLREQGAAFEQLVDYNEAYKINIKHFLSVDDLNNLIKSGRLTNVSAMIGKILKVKPIMSMRKGKGAIVAKVRGRKKVYMHYINAFKKRVDMDMTNFIIVGYTSDQSVAETLKKKLREETDFEGDIYIMQMGVSVGTHVGLGGLSMYFIEKGHRHDGLIYNEMSALIAKKDEMIQMIKNYEKRK